MHAHLRLLATLLTLTATLVSLAAPGPGPAAAQAEGARLHLPLVVSPRPGVSPQVQALLPFTYYLVRDSDGTQPAPGAVVVMGFEPQGAAHIYAADADDAMAYSGTYSYDQGRLALRFADPDFTVEAGVALDPAAESVTMPFQVFSAEPGSSTWRRERQGIAHNLRLVYQAALRGDGLTEAQAFQRALSYAQAMVSPAGAALMDGDVATCPSVAGVRAVGGDTIAVTFKLCSGLYQEREVLLLAWAPLGVGASLQPSPLAGDPRVHLNTLPAQDSDARAGDAPNKSALIILAKSANARGLSLKVSELSEVLKQHGYTVPPPLIDEAVTIPRLIAELRKNPGVVIYFTHGTESGRLVTSESLGSNESQYEQSWRALAQRLIDEGYGELLTYTYEGQPALKPFNVPEDDFLPGAQDDVVALTPAFWHWLRERQGANFRSSLVYIGACSTGATPDLTEAIEARAHFAYATRVAHEVAGGVALYMMQSLSRPTRSAEEAYYNVRRVATTGQYIYAEDRLLDTLTDWTLSNGSGKAPSTFKLAFSFHAYSWTLDGMQNMATEGWLGGAVSPGDVWWLLFTGRWGQDAQAGAEGIMACWERYWSQGQHAPAIGDPLCRNREPGSVPSENEVDYTLYLLTGKHYLSFDGTPVPRWTLNDAAARLEAAP